TTGNLVQGNFIGTNAAGAAAIPNSFAGISLQSGTNANTIGGVGAGNLISGNASYGIVLITKDANNKPTRNNVLQGNPIGTDATGKNPGANGQNGMALWGGASGNLLGGTAFGQGNTIAFNSRDGVRISDSATTGNSVRGNSIFGNGRLGLNLVGGSENSA